MSSNNLASFYNRVFNHYNSHNKIRFAFAYGSGVFKQLNNQQNTSNTIIDFVFVVDNAIEFHDLNVKHNSGNYSFLKYFGPYYLSKIQNQYGAACYYNTLVRFEDYYIKYGIIEKGYFLKDLYDWDYLYLSGRLHKPVQTLSKPLSSEDQISDAFNVNLKNAMHTALLLLPQAFTLEELFLCITNLSYQGDLRMTVGAENKSKILNIVKPNFEHFYSLYKPLIVKETFHFLHFNEATMQLTQDKSTHGVYHNLNFLPKNLIQTITLKSIHLRQYQDTEEIIFKLAKRRDVKQIINKAINNIVQKSSTSQTIKGLFTAGLFKSVNYAARKFKKMLVK